MFITCEPICEAGAQKFGIILKVKVRNSALNIFVTVRGGTFGGAAEFSLLLKTTGLFKHAHGVIMDYKFTMVHKHLLSTNMRYL